MNLSPYAKSVVSAVGTLVALAVQFLVGDGADAATLGTAIIGALTTLGVYQVTNEPLTASPSTVPSSHTRTPRTTKTAAINDLVRSTPTGINSTPSAKVAKKRPTAKKVK